MKQFLTALLLVFSSFGFSGLAYAQNPEAAAPAIEQPAADAAPVVPMVEAPADQVVQDPIMVPPGWLQEALIMVKAMPGVGPYVVMGLQYLGVIGSVLTALCAFLMVLLNVLQGVVAVGKLDGAAKKIKELQNSKIMFWLKYLSMFNAKDKK